MNRDPAQRLRVEPDSQGNPKRFCAGLPDCFAVG
jgi:hypothetical protein